MRAALLLLLAAPVWAQKAPGASVLARTFELRAFSDDSAADGVTDFKGETSIFSTDDRVDFLGAYADYAASFFGDPGLDTPVVTGAEAREAVAAIKPQPLPPVRTRLPLSRWRFVGAPTEDGRTARAGALARYGRTDGLDVQDGGLVWMEASTASWDLPTQAWRAKVEWRARLDAPGRAAFTLSDRGRVPSATVGFGPDGRLFYTTAGDTLTGPAYVPGRWHRFSVFLDFGQADRKEPVRYTLRVDGQTVADAVPMERVVTGGPGYAETFSSVGRFNTFAVRGPAGLALDDVVAVGYLLTGRDNYPFTSETVLDEPFEPAPDTTGWTGLAFDDGAWDESALPVAWGSERHADEALLLRTVVAVPDGLGGPGVERAVLRVEAVWPSATLYVNGLKVAHLVGQVPREIDVTAALRPGRPNVLAVRVDPFMLTQDVGEVHPHSLLDFHTAWFAGRMSLDLTARTTLDHPFAYVTDLGGDGQPLRLRTEATVDGRGATGPAELVVRVAPWFPDEGPVVAEGRASLTLTGEAEQPVGLMLDVSEPQLWTPDRPALYRVEYVLEREGRPVDGAVVTTGLRTVSQEGGTFRLNGEPAMLNGAGVMGFRGPVDSLAVNLFYPRPEWLATEILQVKAGDGNMMRVHVHGWEFPAENTNDPRLPEMADQLGLMLIWGTPAWVRTGWTWRQIDFEAYPYYVRQVRNHPSIVMWEIANHTQSFKGKPASESNAYIRTAYETVWPVDPSRLVSFNSFIRHFHYANDAGTLDYEGNPMVPDPAWTAPGVTRGNQDAPTGYGNDWSVLRQWPADDTAHDRQDFLDSPDRAYFNFEHEESAAQANWTLTRGTPAHRVLSYEHRYDEGSIGRRLTTEEWRESQAWQAFSAWEATKKQRLLDVDGFSWISLHGGPNTGTYMKPFIDLGGHAKLAFYTHAMAVRPVTAGSADVDVVYGPGDRITPVVMNLGPARTVDVEVTVRSLAGATVARQSYRAVALGAGRTATPLAPFRPGVPTEGTYAVEYAVTGS